MKKSCSSRLPWFSCYCADELNVCTIPENDSLGAVTQLITRALTGQIGAYLEFYEFFSHGALLGVPITCLPRLSMAPYVSLPAALDLFREACSMYLD